MKLHIILLLLFAGHISARAQEDSFKVWNKWCASKDTLLLFNGGNNMIRVYSKTKKPFEYKLKSLDKSLRIGQPMVKGDTMSVLAMPYPEKGKEMRLAILHARSNKLLGTVVFTSDDIPDLVPRLGNIDKPEAPKKVIMAQTRLRAEFPNSLYSYPYTVKQYTLHIYKPKDTATFRARSVFLGVFALKAIKDAPEGSTLEFSDIIVSCPECILRPLDNLAIKIR